MGRCAHWLGSLVSLVCVVCLGVAQAQAQTGQALVDAAYEAAVAQDPAVRAVIAKATDRLAQTRDAQEKLQIIEGLGRVGDLPYREAEVARIHLAVLGQRVLMQLAENRQESGPVRQAALLGLIRVDARDHVLDKAIDLAQAEPQVFSGADERLKDFQRRRNGSLRAAGAARAVDPQKESQARSFLKAHKVSVTISALGTHADRGDVEVVQALLDAGVDPNAQGVASISILTSAVTSGCIERVPLPRLTGVLQALLQAGADINVLDGGGSAPLLYAVRHQCSSEVIARLIELGAVADHRNQQGFSALLAALMAGQAQTADLLVRAGAHVTQDDLDGIFFEPPEDAAIQAVIARALR